MCDPQRNGSAQGIVTLRMKSPSVTPFFTPTESNPQISSSVNSVFNFPNTQNFSMGSSQNAANFNLSEYQRLQFYDYASQASVRLRLSHPTFATNSGPYSLTSAYNHPAFTDGTQFTAISPFARFDSRFRFMHEEPKPQHSYIGLIAMAILSLPEQKMVLSDIYQYILDNYPYFRNRGPGWRNSIRHNLSLNDCFVKAGRSANGKGHYWAIHPANIEDFKKGDFRRRKAQRKVRKHMGLAVPEDDDSPSPTPPPLPPPTLSNTATFGASTLIAPTGIRINTNQTLCPTEMNLFNDLRFAIPSRRLIEKHELRDNSQRCHEELQKNISRSNSKSIKRQFDVESLLAPDCDSTVDENRIEYIDKKSDLNDGNEQIDENIRSNTPSISSQIDYIVNKADSIDSNSSSPSISSTAEKPRSPLPNSLSYLPTAGLSLSPTTWRTAHLQSLQNLHQMNAGIINQSLQSVGSAGFSANFPWAMSAAAISNAQMAATILGYASVANQAFDLSHDGNKR